MEAARVAASKLLAQDVAQRAIVCLVRGLIDDAAPPGTSPGLLLWAKRVLHANMLSDAPSMTPDEALRQAGAEMTAWLREPEHPQWVLYKIRHRHAWRHAYVVAPQRGRRSRESRGRPRRARRRLASRGSPSRPDGPDADPLDSRALIGGAA